MGYGLVHPILGIALVGFGLVKQSTVAKRLEHAINRPLVIRRDEVGAPSRMFSEYCRPV